MRSSRYRNRFVLLTTIIAGLCPIAGPLAHAAAFADVPSDHFAFEAVEYLKAKNILGGYANGTFSPDKRVNRAEALKIITAPLMSEAQKAIRTSAHGFSDVPADAWYIPYLEWARKHGAIINFPPKSPTFNGERAISKAEFIKMLFMANNIDPNAYGEVTLPLSSDVPKASDWFYPYMRYGVSSAVVTISQSGLFSPARELTRSDVAVLVYRFIQYRDGDRTQTLLSEARRNIELVLESLEKSDIREAEYASARAILSARGALAKKPNEPVVKVAVKTSESVRALVRAYRAGIDGDIDLVIKLSQDAWYLAEQARATSPEASQLATQLESYAKTFADSARSRKK